MLYGATFVFTSTFGDLVTTAGQNAFGEEGG